MTAEGHSRRARIVGFRDEPAIPVRDDAPSADPKAFTDPVAKHVRSKFGRGGATSNSKAAQSSPMSVRDHEHA